jgi:GNAT superfamily N-acetyltransferase
MKPVFSIRPATVDEIPVLEALVATSARALSKGFYSDAESDAAIKHVFGVDSELVADGTYLVAELGSALAGCGGWSKRSTLFGGDRYEGRTSGLLDPAADAAKIRAFFVGPKFARLGVGSTLLSACEAAARSAGFARTELMATLPGVPFYSARGYVAAPRIELDLCGVSVAFVPMAKHLGPVL